MTVIGFISRKLNEIGSTRPVGLFRLCLGVLLYMRFGKELSLHAADSFAEQLFSLAYFGAAAFVTIGLFTRLALVSSAILLGLMYYGQFWGWFSPGWGHHHHYLLMICCIVLAFSGAGRSFSADRAISLARTGRAPEERAYTWPQTLLVLQLCAIYFWAAWDKTSAGYLSGDWLERVFEWVYAGNPAYDLVTNRVFLVAGSWAVLIVEYLLPIAILLRWRLKLWIPIAFALHAGFYIMLPVQTYSATMMALYLLVVDPDWLDTQIDTYLIGKAPLDA
ncbi:MAG: HTTM domain-containing protein [Pseudomonadota bacterium]